MPDATFSIVRTPAGPRLAVNGEPQPAVAALPDPFAKPLLPVNEVPALRDFADAGVRLFSNVWSMRCRPHDWWLGEGIYDWGAFDALALGLLATCPDGWIMPRIKIDPPEWWCAGHSGEMSASKAEVNPESRPWRDLYRQMLRDVIAHVGAASYAGRVAGYHIGGLHCGEWMDWKLPESAYPPVDARWAGDPLAPPEATAARRTFLRDRARAVADALLDAAALVKELTNGGKIVCAFFGYAQSPDHCDVMRVLMSGLVDIFSSPACYGEGARGVGDPGVQQAYYTASYALHGRVFYEEADPRTHLAGIPGTDYMSEALRAQRPANLKQTIGVLRRIVGKNLAQGTGLWWFLIAGNGTFGNLAIMETVRRGIEEERRRLSGERPRLTDVAIFTAAGEYATSNRCHAPALSKWKSLLHTDRLPRTGVAYDSYELADIAAPDLPNYEVYVLPNAFSPTSAELAAICRLAAAGKRIVRPERPMSTEELRRLLAGAGAHVWLDTGDVVFAGRGCLTVHASRPGPKRIRLPMACDVSELFGASPLRQGVAEFSEDMDFGETRVFLLSPVSG